MFEKLASIVTRDKLAWFDDIIENEKPYNEINLCWSFSNVSSDVVTCQARRMKKEKQVWKSSVKNLEKLMKLINS